MENSWTEAVTMVGCEGAVKRQLPAGAVELSGLVQAEACRVSPESMHMKYVVGGVWAPEWDCAEGLGGMRR